MEIRKMGLDQTSHIVWMLPRFRTGKEGGVLCPPDDWSWSCCENKEWMHLAQCRAGSLRPHRLVGNEVGGRGLPGPEVSTLSTHGQQWEGAQGFRPGKGPGGPRGECSPVLVSISEGVNAVPGLMLPTAAASSPNLPLICSPWPGRASGLPGSQGPAGTEAVGVGCRVIFHVCGGGRDLHFPVYAVGTFRFRLELVDAFLVSPKESGTVGQDPGTDGSWWECGKCGGDTASISMLCGVGCKVELWKWTWDSEKGLPHFLSPHAMFFTSFSPLGLC